MSLLNEVEDIKQRFSIEITQLRDLLKKYNIENLPSFYKQLKNNNAFKNEVKNIFITILDNEAGKLSLTSIGIILGISFGGMGLAAFGGAIGLPLALILGIGGLASGTEIDSLRSKRKSKRMKIFITKELSENLKAISPDFELDTNEMVVHILEQFVKNYTETVQIK